MKDYSVLSDFEINGRVGSRLGIFERGGFAEEEAKDEGIVFRNDENGKFYEFDPCNKFSDAWPIIEENKITIIMDNKPSYRVTENCIGWFSDETPPISICDKNPMRAAMIVFLMMKDAGK